MDELGWDLGSAGGVEKIPEAHTGRRQILHVLF